MQYPTQGPMYFPMDRTGAVGQDPIYLLNRNNTDLPATRSNLVNAPYRNSSYGTMNNSFGNKTPYPATGNTSADDDPDKKSSSKLGRILGLIIVLIACGICLVGIINIIVASTLASDSINPWGCLSSASNYFASTLGPTTASMVILTWIWVSVGMWAAIPPFVAGIALFISRKPNRKLEDSSFNPGLPMELQNSENNYTNAPDVYRIFAIFSIIFCLPICFVIGIIDVILSSYCSTSGSIVKFILPIIVVILAIVEFVLILFSWYKLKDASDSEYQYIGSTYTVYESYEPIYKEANPIVNETAVVPTTTKDHCCGGGSSNPIIIVNQPPANQTQAPPVNVLVRNDPPRPLMYSQPPPLPPPPPRPIIRVPVPIPVSMPPQVLPVRRRPIEQRYYPSQVYGPNFGRRPNTYGGMYLPPAGPSLVTSPYSKFIKRS